MARRLSVLMLGLLILASTTPALAQAAPQFPPLTGRIVDEARLLSPAKEAEIDAKWRDEVGARLDDILTGRVELVSFEETRAKTRALLNNLRP